MVWAKDTKSAAGNPEREKEEKAKQEKWDRTIAMHLDTGIKGKTPWYMARNAGSMETTKSKRDDKDFEKIREDPLSTMQVMLDKHEKHRKKRSKSPSRSHRRSHDQDSARHHKPSQEQGGMNMVRMELDNKTRVAIDQAILNNPTAEEHLAHRMTIAVIDHIKANFVDFYFDSIAFRIHASTIPA
ncbi:hypothetical protein BGZ94_001521 [Podila epigama]|nr:hypothetical protein BGZ94_001521 [Podila epigama]